MIGDLVSGVVIDKIINIVLKRAIPIGNKWITTWTSPELVPNWKPRLNAYLDESAIVIQQISMEPEIYVKDQHQLTDSQKAQAKKHLVKNRKLNRPNDLHAILLEESNIYDVNPVLYVNYLDFAGVSSLREDGLKPAILSSSAVLLCEETKEIILHRRADNIATYSNSLHTLGGAYIPTDIDRGGIRSTVDREIKEETQVNLSSDDSPPMMISKELTTGFIQIVYLGFNLTPKALKLIKDSWEGSVVRVPFSDLPSILQRKDWVPSGKAHVLAWLALGAPGTSKKTRFDKYTAAELFNEVVGVQPSASTEKPVAPRTVI